MMHACRLLAALGLVGLIVAVAAPARAQDSMIAGHFRLIGSDGRTVDSDALAGQRYGIFFGFTHCPDVCPMTLSDLSQALAGLRQAPDLRVYFVTVDPERDTPALLKSYLGSFDPRLVGLSGDRAAVDEAVRSFGVVARRTDFPNGTYAYGHTASVMLVDGDGLIVDRLSANDDATVFAKRLAAFAGSANRPPLTVGAATQAGRDRDGQSGFSLIEMLVVMAILALAASVIGPSLAAIVPGRRLDAAADAVAGELGRLRAEALRTGRAARLVFEPAGARFVSSRDMAADVGMGRLAMGTIDMTGFQVRLETASTSLGPAGEVRFLPNGSSTGGRIVIAGSGGARLLTISRITGVVHRSIGAP